MNFQPIIKRDNNTFKSQTWTSEPRPIKGYSKGAEIRVNARFDDHCGNGHNEFAITADIYRGRVFEAGGCLHEDIAANFPELKRFIKWHLVSTKGPFHYIANTVYLAGNRDHNGLLRGETKQIVNGRTGIPSWILDTHQAPKIIESETRPAAPSMEYVPWLKVGEGKERQLELARQTAVWPEATDEQLCLPKAELKTLLEARLPKLLEDFETDVRAFGFQWK